MTLAYTFVHFHQCWTILLRLKHINIGIVVPILHILYATIIYIAENFMTSIVPTMLTTMVYVWEVSIISYIVVFLWIDLFVMTSFDLITTLEFSSVAT